MKVTHFFHRPADRLDWTPLAFLTKRMGAPSENYFLGFETFRAMPQRQVSTLEKLRQVHRLDFPCPIRPGQSLWLTPENEVVVASEADPIGDNQKLVIESLADLLVAGNQAQALVRTETVQAAARSGELNYVFGDYLNAARATRETGPYQPAWQSAVMRNACRQLNRLLAGKAKREFQLHELQGLAHHRFSLIREMTLNGQMSICWEMIFGTHIRNRDLGIIHLANVKDLSLVYIKDSPAHRMLQLQPGKLFARTFEQWIRRLNEARIKICAFTEQSPEHALLKAVTTRKLTTEIDQKPTVPEVIYWLKKWSDRDNGCIAACDIGVAKNLIAAGKNEAPFAMSTVPYESPVQVGIAYNKADQPWHRFLRDNMQSVMNSHNETVAESFADTKERCAEVGLNWVGNN